MTQLADAEALVAVPELGVEDPGEDVPLLQPANATTNTSAATQRMPTVCGIGFSSNRYEPGSTVVTRRRRRVGSPPAGPERLESQGSATTAVNINRNEL
jgi:hypothetical protein